MKERVLIRGKPNSFEVEPMHIQQALPTVQPNFTEKYYLSNVIMRLLLYKHFAALEAC